MNVLFCPIFSMRSYETGQYSILKDGNFQLMMSRVLASDFDRVFVSVPDDASDFEEVLKRFDDGEHVHFVRMKYGENAVGTRDLFWESNAELMKNLQTGIDLLITDITGYQGTLPVVYNLNITKLPELDRPYIDRFFETDLKSIEQSLFTTVLNPRQREYILEVRPDLLDKVIVNTKCAHSNLLPKFQKSKAPEKLIFWPFRISDKAYKWKEFLEAFIEQGLEEQGYTIVITDPNDTYSSDWVTERFVTKVKLSKDEYYEMLSSRPIIVMLDNIDTVLHPGTIEFFHYRCPTITYESDLYENENGILLLSELSDALRILSHPIVDTQVWNFVYSPDEVDQFYNKEYINVVKN